MNNVDILAQIASKTIDLTNLRTTPTTHTNFVSSYGQPMMTIDDGANINTVGILNNSGGASFTNGIQVTSGVNISYDSNTALNLDSMGSHITGPFSVNGNITGTNATQTNITCPLSLVLTQTGDTSGAPSLTIQNRGGLHGIQVATSDPTLPIPDFDLATGNSDLKYIRLDGRAII